MAFLVMPSLCGIPPEYGRAVHETLTDNRISPPRLLSSVVHPPDERSFRIPFRRLNNDSDRDRNLYSIRAGTNIHIRPDPLFTSSERLFSSPGIRNWVFSGLRSFHRFDS